MELGLDIVKGVAGWAIEARKAARTRAQRRLANVVEHAGLIVGGATRLDGRMTELIGPLRYYDHNEWPVDQRSKLIAELSAFSNESVVVPRMRSALAALEVLVPCVADMDVKGPAEEIVNNCAKLFHYAEMADNGGGLTGAVASIIAEYADDFLITDWLPDLTEGLRGGSEDSDWSVRLAAKHLLDPYRYSFEGDSHPGMLALLQASFGRLTAAQQIAFPEMPPPAWAFG